MVIYALIKLNSTKMKAQKKETIFSINLNPLKFVLIITISVLAILHNSYIMMSPDNNDFLGIQNYAHLEADFNMITMGHIPSYMHGNGFADGGDNYIWETIFYKQVEVLKPLLC